MSAHNPTQRLPIYGKIAPALYIGTTGMLDFGVRDIHQTGGPDYIFTGGHIFQPSTQATDFNLRVAVFIVSHEADGTTLFLCDKSKWCLPSVPLRDYQGLDSAASACTRKTTHQRIARTTFKQIALIEDMPSLDTHNVTFVFATCVSKFIPAYGFEWVKHDTTEKPHDRQLELLLMRGERLKFVEAAEANHDLMAHPYQPGRYVEAGYGNDQLTLKVYAHAGRSEFFPSLVPVPQEPVIRQELAVLIRATDYETDDRVVLLERTSSGEWTLPTIDLGAISANNLDDAAVQLAKSVSIERHWRWNFCLIAAIETVAHPDVLQRTAVFKTKHSIFDVDETKYAWTPVDRVLDNPFFPVAAKFAKFFYSTLFYEFSTETL